MDMGKETVLCNADTTLLEMPNLSRAVGVSVRKYYAMHTGMVLVDITALCSWEYVRDITDVNVDRLVKNLLVRECSRTYFVTH